MSIRQKKSLLTSERLEKITFLFPSMGNLMKMWIVLDFLVYTDALTSSLNTPPESTAETVLSEASQEFWYACQGSGELLRQYHWECVDRLYHSVVLAVVAAQDCRLPQRTAQTAAKITGTGNNNSFIAITPLAAKGKPKASSRTPASPLRFGSHYFHLKNATSSWCKYMHLTLLLYVMLSCTVDCVCYVYIWMHCV